MESIDEAFHRDMKAAKPDVSIGEDVYLVGLLKHKKIPADANFKADVLWVKCRARSKVSHLKAQYLERYLLSQDIHLRHCGVFLPGGKRIGELDRDGDRVIAIEVIAEGDMFARRRDIFKPLVNDSPRNTLTPLAHEGSVKEEPGSQSPWLSPALSSNRGQLQTPLNKNMSPAIHEAEHSQSPASLDRIAPAATTETIPVDFDEFVERCAMRDFVHERLAENFPQRKMAVRFKKKREDIVSLWPILSKVHKVHRTRARLFLEDMDNKGSRFLLDHFIQNNAGFYLFRFSSKGPIRRFSTLDASYTFMKTKWDVLSSDTRHKWAEYARELRHTSAMGKEFFPLVSTPHTTLSHPCQTASPEMESSIAHPEPPPPPPPPHLDLQKLFAESDTETLEAAAKVGVELLESLKEPLSRLPAEEAAQWLQTVQNIQGQAAQPRTIVGVVGNTGAGKSSIINAMLDEERLVPTNCMRACTAVVTEISYNHSEDPYRAEIEFIAREDWEKELRVLFNDLLDGTGQISREATNEDSEAGVAYAKIKAVYPKHTREMLQESTVDKLMQHSNVQNVLGARRQISETDSLRFYKKLLTFVDSKEKTTGEKDKDRRSSVEMELWPLIKVVRLYVKASALSTGAVVVDLPGVHDSNAARSSVAEGYMKQCTGLWIVAPITRAVDDKAAKSLLGETFKRQLKMDGGLNTVTFICSKTDDISIMECQDSLGLEEEMGALWAKSEGHASEKRDIKQRLEELKETKQLYAATTDSIDEELETWETLKEDLDDGKTVFPPSDQSSKKRKRSGGQKDSRKQSRNGNSDIESDSVASDSDNQSDDDDDEGGNTLSRGDPLTKEKIVEKITELKATKKESRRRKLDLEAEIKELRKQVSAIDEAESDVQGELSSIAISGRNKYSRGAIQQDFAAGVRELDQELAEEEDAANFNPDVDARDYDQVAQSLPVFCVSSRGYQKLQGRLRKEPSVPGFRTIEETEIPQLQAHCRNVTDTNRETCYRRFLNSLNQLLNSLWLWSSPDLNGAHLTDDQKSKQASMVRSKLQQLETDMETLLQKIYQDIRNEFKSAIFDTCDTAVSAAENAASQTVLRWAAPINRANRAAGGYLWGTYKAICRRNGTYANAQGPHDWNAELIEPVIKAVASDWEQMFSRRVQFFMKKATQDSGKLFESFHNSVQDEVSGNSRALGSLQMLSHQLENYRRLLHDLYDNSGKGIVLESREINRMFQPVIGEALNAAYYSCTAERGPGSFMRMKATMAEHVEKARLTMFSQSADVVKNALEKLITSEKKRVIDSAEEVMLSVERDYCSALIGSHSISGNALPRTQRLARSDIFMILEKCEPNFKRLAGWVEESEKDSSPELPSDGQLTTDNQQPNEQTEQAIGPAKAGEGEDTV
ncbi:hypothetical protein ASPZODRAFT_128885 [Penicilliopsis zonata CBS 506.65]|uniref:G domain-containing protein n=1 Tax=Penicilliopsis zonata CBS 506.65 TaxID=1073090 RepID=A0A1L9ST29_9EURO|nr:hypothetical protein ASPZODRAFT_128885 [Penicilliopsis zonata CBS 506.65]OJJ50257.1 hypothetical protein ASPZODRAFT_128885 [Penicilliopsis zonata CBS 506.65]